MSRCLCFLMLSSALLLLILATADGNPKAKAISLETNIGSLKSSEKMGYPKKVNSAKKRPTKSPTTAEGATGPGEASNATALADDLTQLGADDLEFIAALEKQFTMYGGKIRFKVEHVNSTDPKNPKRTVEGELGYGYSQSGYEYRKPTFAFYPYSQKDIPPDAPGYYPGHQASSITVQPSYSYELQPQKYEVPASAEPQADLPGPSAQAYQQATGPSEEEHQLQQQSQQQHQPLEQPQSQPEQQQQPDGNYDGPVIVLRIPGPAKYAAHLQALLQRYVQIRATQYLQLLEGSAASGGYQPQYQQQQAYAEEEQGGAVSQHQHYELSQYDQALSSLGAQHQQQHYEQVSTPVSQSLAAHQQYEAPQYEQATSAQPAHDHQQYEAPQYEEHTTLSGQHHSAAPNAHTASYPDIGDVYQNYKHRHQHQSPPQHFHQQQHELSASHVQSEPEYCPEEGYHLPPATSSVPSYYYPHDHHHHHHQPHLHYEGGSHLSTNIHQPHTYQSVLFYSVPTAPIYDTANVAPVSHHQPSSAGYASEDPLHTYVPQHLRTTENNPRATHTQVLFTPHTEASEGAHETMYALPSIRPYERHPPAPVAGKQYYHAQRQQQQHPELTHNEQQRQFHQNAKQSGGTSGNIVDAEQRQQVNYQQSASPKGPTAPQKGTIAQRPYNYHAHPAQGSASAKNKRDSSTSTVSSPHIVSLTALREPNKFGDKISSKMGAKNSGGGE